MRGPKKIFLNPKYKFNGSVFVSIEKVDGNSVEYVRGDLALNEEVIQKILDVDDRLIKEMLVEGGRMPSNSKAYCKKILSEVRAWHKENKNK